MRVGTPAPLSGPTLSRIRARQKSLPRSGEAPWRVVLMCLSAGSAAELLHVDWSYVTSCY